MRSIFALGMLALAGLSIAQDTPQQDYPYTIDPNSVSDSDRQTWCDNQKAQCPLICLQQPGVETSDTEQNDCDPEALTYSCVCDNGVSPNVTQYSQTLPYYICTAWGTQCVAACSDNTCADKCRADHPCGAQDPPKPNNTASSTTRTAAQTGASTSIPVNGFLGASATAGADDNGAASSMYNLGASYSLAVVFAGVFAGFAIFL